MTPQEIKAARKAKQDYRDYMTYNTDFQNFAADWNAGIIREPETVVPVPQDDPVQLCKDKERRKRNSENWKNVKREWLMKITVEYAAKPMFCHLCGKPIMENEKVSPDHLITRASANGDYDSVDKVENLRESHADCNFARGSNKINILKYYDRKLKAEVEKYSFFDIHRTSWKISFRYFENKPVIQVVVISKTNGGHRQVEETYYTSDGRRMNRKSKQKYYNHNALMYGTRARQKNRGGGINR